MIEKSPIQVKESEKNLILLQAYKQFSLETERLELAYQSLEKHFHQIQSSLQDTQTKLYGKLAELDFTTSYLDSILSHISQGILFVDLNGIVTTYNMAAEEMFGISSKSALFHPIWDFFSDTAFGFSLRESLQTKQCPSVLMTNWMHQEKKLELEVNTTFVAMSSSLCSVAYQDPPSVMVQGLLILVRNITEFRRLQALASRHDRLQELGEMAARMAHEIRNPLGGIKGFASLLEQDLKDRPELQQMAAQIVEGTDNLNQFVSNILNYTRPFQLQFELIDLIPLIQDILQFIQADKSITPSTVCELQCSENQLIVPIDPPLFKSALLNLCINALQAMPEGGVLSIIVTQEGSQASIEVRDTGVGIAEENLDRIFSPFFTTKEMGNGLGLSEVHKIVQAHRGTIEVQSQLGHGSSFIIKIPIKVL